MHPIGIAAPDGETDAIAEHLVAILADDGRVALVEADATAGAHPPEATTSYRLGGDGAWIATGTGMDLPGALDRLAPDHDYAVVTGHPDAAIPHVAVGDPDYDGEVLLSVPGADDLDARAVREALADAEPYETLESLVARVKRAPDADMAGAIATFTGRVRERDGDDDAPTTHLEFEKYAGVAEERMDALAAEFEGREGVHAVAMHHRTGVVEAGEDIVFVVVLAGHRVEAFDTVEDGIDRLKAEVPIFKKEVTVDEEFWIHERP